MAIGARARGVEYASKMRKAALAVPFVVIAACSSPSTDGTEPGDCNDAYYASHAGRGHCNPPCFPNPTCDAGQADANDAATMGSDVGSEVTDCAHDTEDTSAD